MALLNFGRENKAICAVVFSFFALKAFTIPFYKIVWWDAAVYAGMGKYIYSLGNLGLWEHTRPILWPAILGFFWKMGLNQVLAGRIIEMAFGGFCVILTYLIAKRLFDKKTALLASLFLAISPTFFFFNGIMLTEVVSTLFALIGMYTLFRNKPFFSGLFFGLAFLARFLQFMVFIPVLLSFYFFTDKKNLKFLLWAIAGFAVVMLPFLALNQALYDDLLFPFTQHILITQNSGWPNYQPLKFYFLGLFNENLFYFLAFFGIIKALRDPNQANKSMAFAFLVPFLFFNSIKQKEMRFLIIIMPHIYILIASAITNFFTKVKKDIYKQVFTSAIIISLAFSAFNIYIYYQKEYSKTSPYEELESRFAMAYGNIWVSSPIIAANHDKKIARLIYYPFFSKTKQAEMNREIISADFVFIDMCDIGCKPADSECDTGKNDILLNLRQKLKTDFHSKNNGCGQYVFRK
ncbi:glycosyltransferase family 39 protein [Candidatus Woesearchaeota archaeon]|nr:glycosyltransferase family 39 protein [Candidatus Woesearchaeota archaeon]